MHLADPLERGFVVRRLSAKDTEGALSEIAHAAADAGLGDAAEILRGLRERERLHPTVMGQGLAIPHAIVAGLDAPTLGVALTGAPGIAFGPGDEGATRLLFVLLAPPGHEGVHVRLLARLCRLVRAEGFLERLEGAPTAADVAAIILAADAEHP